MLLVRRILAGLIDLILFIGSISLVTLLLIKFKIYYHPLDLSFQFIVAFVCCIIVPILIFSRTLGEKWMCVFYKDSGSKWLRINLIAKYFFLYSLATLNVATFLGFLSDFLDTYSYIHITVAFAFRFDLVILVSDFTVLALTLGKHTLLERIFGISVQYRSSGVRPISALLMTYIFAFFMIAGIGLDRKFNDLFDFKSFKKTVNSLNQVNFPIDEFSNYAIPGNIYYRIKQTNMVVTKSDPISFVTNRLLYQRQIEVIVKDDLLYDSKKREDLCNMLINYCYDQIDLQVTNELVMQTKIMLVNIKYVAPFIGIVSRYDYYFDDKAQQYGFHGGYNPDSLNNYYLRSKKIFVDTVIRYLNQSTGIAANIISLKLKKNPAALFAKLPQATKLGLDSINLAPLIDNRLITMNPTSFDSVKPKRKLMFSYPVLVTDVFGPSFYDMNFIGAMISRNNLFHLY